MLRDRRELRSYLFGFGNERAERRAATKDVVCLAGKRRRTTCVRQGQMGFRELELSVHREPGQTVGHHRPRALCGDEGRPGSRALPLGDCEPRRDCQQDRGHDVVRRRRSSTNAPARTSSDSAAARSPRSSAKARARSAPPRRPRSLLRRGPPPQPAPGWPPLGRDPREQHAIPCKKDGDRMPRARSGQARRRELGVDLHLLDTLSAEQGADRAAQASKGLPSGIGPRTGGLDRQRPTLGGSDRPRNAWIQPPTPRSRDTARAGRTLELREPALDGGHAAATEYVNASRRRAWRAFGVARGGRVFDRDLRLPVRLAPRGCSAVESGGARARVARARPGASPGTDGGSGTSGAGGRGGRRTGSGAPAARASAPSRHARAPRHRAGRTCGSSTAVRSRNSSCAGSTRLSSSARR